MSAPAELVSFLTCDLTGILRGRSFPRADLDRRLSTGVGWVPANQSLTPWGEIAAENPHGSTGDLVLAADPETAVEVELQQGDPPLSFYLCDVREPDGSAHECCPRTVLRDAAIGLHSEFDLEATVSFEHEFALLSEGESEPPFSLRAQRAIAPFGEAVVAALREARAEPEMFLPEYGPHQYEVTCAPAAPVRAADRAAVIREVVREVGRLQSRPITFSPMTAPEGVCNGVHIHLSLRPADGSEPGAPGELGITESEAAFAAGVLRHARALCALTAPSAISYVRLQPHHWSAGTVALGRRNRETMVRICGPENAPCHLEYRAADAVAGPHLALAALLLAGMEGIRDGLGPPPSIDRDPSQMEPEQLARLAPVRLPATLGEALESLRADEVASGWLPPLLLETYMGAKRSELAAVDQLEPIERHARYRRIY